MKLLRCMLIALFSYLFFLNVVFSLDEITLKNGDILKGKLDDKRETDKEVYIDVSTTKGISDFKAISKSDIENIKKSDGSEDAAAQLALPAESVDVKWYDEQIEKALKPWVSKYTQSPLLPQMQQKLTDFVAEKDRVKAGDIKMGGKWYSRTEFEEVRIDIDALKFLADVRDLASRKDFSELLKIKAKSLGYKTSIHFDKIVEAFMAGFKEFQSGGYEQLIQKQVADLQYSITQNESYIRQSINESIPAITFTSDDVMEWDALRSSGPLEAAKRSTSTSTYKSFNFIDETRFYVRFSGNLYVLSSILPEWNRSDSVYGDFVKDFKNYYNDPNAPKLRLSSSTMNQLRKLYQDIDSAKEKIKTVKKESESIGQFEDRIAKAVTEFDALRIENFALAQKSIEAALSAHERRDFNVTMSELRGAAQAWPGLILIDRTVKKVASDYFADSKANVEKGDLAKAVDDLTHANQILPVAKAKFMALVTLKTDINKYMNDNKQMIELLKKQEADQKKKDQEQQAFVKKFESDFNRGDFITISKTDMKVLEGSENFAAFEEKKKTAISSMDESKALVQQIKPLIEQKKLAEANDALLKARSLWALNPSLSDLTVLLAEAMRPKTFLDTIQENMVVSIAIFFVVFLGIAFGVARFLSK